MKHLLKGLALLLLLMTAFYSCTKETVEPKKPVVKVKEPPVVDSTAIVLAREQKAASDYAVAQSLLNEVLAIPFQLAYQNPELFGVKGGLKAESRGGCPMDTLLMAQGTGDTLVIDFGNGCTLPGGATVSGEIWLNSFGSLISNANQFVIFDTITINGYEIIHIPGIGSSGLKFNNVGGLAYLFEGKVPTNTFFKIISPNGDITTIVPLYSGDIWSRIQIVDNDPPLELDYDDFQDACFRIELNELTVSTFRTDGTIDTYFVRKYFDANGVDEVVYKPSCRWFNDGRLVFSGTLNQTLDFGYDLNPDGLPIPGETCDGVVKITTPAGDCRVVVCP